MSSSCSSDCESITFSQFDLRCIDGKINIYKKDVTITKGEWTLYKTTECCNCIESSSNSSDGIIVDCCQNAVPTTLYLHLSNITSSCTIPSTFQLDWAGGSLWRYDCTLLPDEECYIFWELSCGATWTLSSGFGNTPIIIESVSCDPFELQGQISANANTNSDCSGTNCCTFTVDYIINTTP